MTDKPFKIIVGNRYSKLTRSLPEKTDKLFEYRDPSHYFNPGFQFGTWDGMNCLAVTVEGTTYIPTGLLLQQLPALEKMNVKLNLVDKRVFPKFTSRKFYGEPTKHQSEGCVKMKEAANTGAIILNATGTGKTFLAALFFSQLAGEGVFLVDEKTLAYQTKAEFERFLKEPIGFRGDGKSIPGRITVALVQTLQREIKHKPDQFKQWAANQMVVIIDEFHGQLNDRTKTIVKTINPLAVFGVTATLELNKPHVMMEATAIAGPPVYTFPYNEALKAGVLAPGVVVGVDLYRSHPDKIDPAWLYRSFVVTHERRNKLVCAMVKEGVARDFHVAVLVDLPSHAKRLSRMLKAIPHNVVYGDKSAKHRLESKARFEQGERKLLIANRVFKKGINIRVLDVIIDAAGLGNKNDAVQKFGRGVRLCQGKRGLLYFDVGDAKGRQSEFSQNKFRTWTTRRRRALAALGVAVTKLRARDVTPKDIYDEAERLLEKYVKKPAQVIPMSPHK